jgi:hypothetical protein
MPVADTAKATATVVATAITPAENHRLVATVRTFPAPAVATVRPFRHIDLKKHACAHRCCGEYG